MGCWNHRVVARTVEGERWLGIHECFYGLDDDLGWTADPVAVEGESIEELRETLHRMLRALDEPIIIDIEEEPTEPERPPSI